MYMRCSIKNSCQWAKTIIAVSKNTKKDLLKLYKVPEEKISVIYEGYADSSKFQIPNFKSNPNDQISKPYLLFIGRLEERKNVVGIIKAFEILKEQYKISHKLILAGKSGFGYEKIKSQMLNVNCSKDIIELGFVNEEEKWKLLKNTDVFIFPTLYEGFGLPILEAQSANVPVVASNNSSIPEVTNGSVLLVNPNNAEEIADAIYKLISDESLRNAIIEKGKKNITRFSWDECAKEIVKIL